MSIAIEYTISTSNPLQIVRPVLVSTTDAFPRITICGGLTNLSYSILTEIKKNTHQI